MIKGVIHASLGPIWYLSELLDIPYSPNKFLALDFFRFSYSKTALVSPSKKFYSNHQSTYCLMAASCLLADSLMFDILNTSFFVQSKCKSIPSAVYCAQYTFFWNRHQQIGEKRTLQKVITQNKVLLISRVMLVWINWVVYSF